MSKNPFLNALAAIIYIILIVTVIDYGMKLTSDREETIVIPIAMISLFTLSTAVMGYLFLYEPFKLHFDGNKLGAIKLFLQTVLIFAVITAIIFILLFSGVFA